MTPQLIASFEKTFPNKIRVAGALSLPARGHSVTVLLGPSGGGKTVTLRCLAGLEEPEIGLITFGDEVWFDADRRVHLTPQQRGIGYVTQEYALFPHLTVAGNVGFGLPRPGRPKRVAEVLALVRMGGLESRYPHQLSGGQRQRVALARTLAPGPRLLLLDEPLSALDAATREELRPELTGVLREAGVPVILVTHDRTEAATLADQLLVVAGGRVLQRGPVAEVLGRPADAEVARVVGVETVVPGRVNSAQDGLATVAVGSAELIAVALPAPSADVLVCVRGEDVILLRDATEGSARNRLAAVVTALTAEGPLVRVGLNAGFSLTAVVTRPSVAQLGLAVGVRVTAWIKAPAVHLIPRGPGSTPG